jgi:hypothetical protein
VAAVHIPTFATALPALACEVTGKCSAKAVVVQRMCAAAVVKENTKSEKHRARENRDATFGASGICITRTAARPAARLRGRHSRERCDPPPDSFPLSRRI